MRQFSWCMRQPTASRSILSMICGLSAAVGGGGGGGCGGSIGDSLMGSEPDVEWEEWEE